MLGIRRIRLHNQPLTPVVVNELINTKENIPTPPQKVRVLPWIILGLVISLILVGAGTLVWKWSQSKERPDIILNAPNSVEPQNSLSVVPTNETTSLILPDVLFEEKPYRNELAKFQINVPLGWKIDDSGKSSSVVVLIDPKATIASGSALLTYVNVSTSLATGGLLKDYVESARTGLVKAYENYVIEEDKDLQISGNTYHFIGGSYTAHNTKFSNRNLLLVFNNRGYAISATAPVSVWSKKELLLNATLFSFKNF